MTLFRSIYLQVTGTGIKTIHLAIRVLLREHFVIFFGFTICMLYMCDCSSSLLAALPSLALPCPPMPSHALSCPPLPSHALPCPRSSPLTILMPVFVCLPTTCLLPNFKCDLCARTLRWLSSFKFWCTKRASYFLHDFYLSL